MGRRSDTATVREVPLRLGEKIELTVERLGYRGEGVARFAGFAVFVDGVLPGERAQVRVTKVHRSYAQAKVEEFLSKVADRVEPPCVAFSYCGGCQLQHMSYEAQLQWKRQTVFDALTRIGKLPHEVVESVLTPALGMQNPWLYRNKIHVLAAERGGRFIAGFVEEGTHEPVSVDTCLIRPQVQDALLACVVKQFVDLGVTAYDPSTGLGDIRQVMIRTTTANEALVVLVTPHPALPHATELCRRITSQAPASVHISGILQYVQSDHGVGLGTFRRVLWGQAHLEESIMGLRYRFSPESFLQVNPVQTETLYQHVADLASIQSSDVVWDLYCGIGTLTLRAAVSAKSVHGVESVPEAIADARYNADLNDVKNVEFHLGRSEHKAKQLLAEHGRPDVVIMDPPRAGCEPEVLQALIEANPRTIVYVSCNPATLARDLRVLCESGYALGKVVPIDMFPQTAHVEMVAAVYRVVVTA